MDPFPWRWVGVDDACLPRLGEVGLDGGGWLEFRWVFTGASGLLATDGDATGKLGILSAKPRLRGLADSVTLSAWFVAWVFFRIFEARVAWDAICAR
jgi:hypothetical protein